MVCVTTMYQPYQMNCYKYEYTVVCRCVWMEEFKYYYRREVNVLYRGGGGNYILVQGYVLLLLLLSISTCLLFVTKSERKDIIVIDLLVVHPRIPGSTGQLAFFLASRGLSALAVDKG